MDESADHTPERRSEVLILDRRLLELTRAVLTEATAAAGAWLACEPGCTECCVGLFPVNRLDALRLDDGLSRLERSDRGRAAAVRNRARRSWELVCSDYPGDPRGGGLGTDDQAVDAFLDRYAALHCPALDPSSGLCDLYDHRPMTCRVCGPPLQLGDELLPPCRLCFDGAPSATVERCRAVLDRERLEGRLLDLLGDDPTAPWDTLVSFALVHAEPPARST